MTDTIARLRVGNKIFETMVDLESATKMKKKGDVSIAEVIRDNDIYTGQKKGLRAGKDDLMRINKIGFNLQKGIWLYFIVALLSIRDLMYCLDLQRETTLSHMSDMLGACSRNKNY